MLSRLSRLFCCALSPFRALQHCEELIQQYNRAEDSICLPDNKSLPHQNVTNHVGKAVEDCMRAIIGVLLNLTNDNGKTTDFCMFCSEVSDKPLVYIFLLIMVFQVQCYKAVLHGRCLLTALSNLSLQAG